MKNKVTRNSSVKNDGSPSKRPASPSTTPNIFVGMGIQFARKYFFIPTRIKIIGISIFVIILSCLSNYVSVEEGYYIVQKHSIFNQYGVKLGWFWTCAIVGPFVWFASKVHNSDRDMPVVDILRLVVATVCWYSMVGLFNRIHRWTSYCSIRSLSRQACHDKGGNWIPGIDISGHCFLMIYSLLIMSEEAAAFRNWHQVNSVSDLSGDDRETKKKNVMLTQIFFILMLVLSLFWYKQLIISVLYYHFFYDKVVGTMAAIACWSLTYKVLYPAGFLSSPIHRS